MSDAAVYATDAHPAPDSDFAPGELRHLVAGNRGRLLDPLTHAGDGSRGRPGARLVRDPCRRLRGRRRELGAGIRGDRALPVRARRNARVRCGARRVAAERGALRSRPVDRLRPVRARAHVAPPRAVSRRRARLAGRTIGWAQHRHRRADRASRGSSRAVRPAGRLRRRARARGDRARVRREPGDEPACGRDGEGTRDRRGRARPLPLPRQGATRSRPVRRLVDSRPASRPSPATASRSPRSSGCAWVGASSPSTARLPATRPCSSPAPPRSSPPPSPSRSPTSTSKAGRALASRRCGGSASRSSER